MTATTRYSPFEEPANIYRPPGAPHQAHSRTSREAADRIKPHTGTLQERVLEYLERCKIRGATDQEIQLALNLESCTQLPRRRELQVKGLVVDSGLKRHNKSGRRAVVWWAM